MTDNGKVSQNESVVFETQENAGGAQILTLAQHRNVPESKQIWQVEEEAAPSSPAVSSSPSLPRVSFVLSSLSLSPSRTDVSAVFHLWLRDKEGEQQTFRQERSSIYQIALTPFHVRTAVRLPKFAKSRKRMKTSWRTIGLGRV